MSDTRMVGEMGNGSLKTSGTHFGFVAGVVSDTRSDARPDSIGLIEVAGVARVIDGDTLEIHGTRIRLEGIDAPEKAQTCEGTKGAAVAKIWPCGLAAIRRLEDLAQGKSVTCRGRERDAYGRLIGFCASEDVDLNATMIRDGLAWAFVKYSNTYVAAEGKARARGAGVWQGPADPPWVWREARWKRAETAAPEGCAIKGNISQSGRIYHVPWGASYDRVRVDVARGERWFCSEADALAAGWRPPANR
ncbi:MAG: thermonuclease family protein [Hyphomicrobium sp.]|nr:thermonuclease family protein [Hyphomicrobium sp.]